MELIPTIGLEIHAQLKTDTKMFCRSKNDPDEKRPNVNVCPVCLAHPGTLPTINKKAVEQVLRVGLALGGKLADDTEFDRKNYFYPDIPKGYQISQYKFPLVSGGELSGVKLTRIHLEEDTATSKHDQGDFSLIDFNRAGVPLMELVTEPVITSAKQAGDFARELQLLLRSLGASEANMEKGEMRVEANISVAPKGERGTKVEVKNLNSFRAVERAIEFELKRQAEVLETGGKIVQETRGWDDQKQVTFSQRKKEFSHDYRYFPDPDLPKLKISEIPEFSAENLRKTLPELPWQKRARLLALGLKLEDVNVLVSTPELAESFRIGAEKLDSNPRSLVILSNYLTNDVVSLINNNFAELSKFGSLNQVVEMVVDGKISSHGAKEILALMLQDTRDPQKIAEEHNLFQKSDEGQLMEIVQKVITDNPKVVADYKSGKTTVLQFLVGQGMKQNKGSANPEILKKLLVEKMGIIIAR